MIEQKQGWITKCDDCGCLLNFYNSEKEAKESLTKGNSAYNSYVCRFCGNTVCYDCQPRIGIAAINIPICKACTEKYTIGELIKKVKGSGK